jgi:hypothetical protein
MFIEFYIYHDTIINLGYSLLDLLTIGSGIINLGDMQGMMKFPKKQVILFGRSYGILSYQAR